MNVECLGPSRCLLPPCIPRQYLSKAQSHLFKHVERDPTSQVASRSHEPAPHYAAASSGRHRLIRLSRPPTSPLARARCVLGGGVRHAAATWTTMTAAWPMRCYHSQAGHRCLTSRGSFYYLGASPRHRHASQATQPSGSRPWRPRRGHLHTHAQLSATVNPCTGAPPNACTAALVERPQHILPYLTPFPLTRDLRWHCGSIL